MSLRLRSTLPLRGTSSFSRSEAVVEAEESTAEYAKYAEKKPVALLIKYQLSFQGRDVNEISNYRQTRFVLLPRIRRIPRFEISKP